jgi:hypothetical protein
VSDIGDLLALIDLTGVRTFEVSGRLLEHEDTPDSEEKQDAQVLVRETSEELLVRVRLTIQTADAQLVADCASIFELKEPDAEESVEIEADLKREFAERVGVMAVYPFLRESIFTTAARLQVAAPVLGLLKVGQFSLAPNSDTPTEWPAGE